jgi:hypothetical protein
MMFGKTLVRDMISRSAENPDDRRKFLQSAGMLGLGVVGASVLPSFEGSAFAAANPISDGAILNFALNLEYLEGEFYSYAVHGHGLAEKLTHGKGTRGGVTGGKKVSFSSKKIHQFAEEIAADELHHVEFLRTALGSAAVSRPAINIKSSFTAAARAAGLVGPHQDFDVYANEDNFLLGAFIFEDIGVTAYKGAAPLISNKTYLGAAAGILAVEAYHAATIRTTLFDKGLAKDANAISTARDSLDGKSNDDQGITKGGKANIVPTDKNGLVYGRTPGRVLNLAYLNPGKVSKGGFFPAGVNGSSSLFTKSGPE